MDDNSHCVLSWIWNEDGTAAVQRLANGSLDACIEFAENAEPVTSDPREQIVVRPRDVYEAALAGRSVEFH